MDFRFEEVIFAAADAANDIFGSEWGGLPSKTTRLTYFVNKNDRALKISERKLKVKRIGKSGSVVAMRNSVSEIDVTDIEDTKGLLPRFTGHGYFFASTTVKEMIIRLLKEYVQEKSRI